MRPRSENDTVQTLLASHERREPSGSACPTRHAGAKQSATDMSGAAFLRIQKLKRAGVIKKAARHNRRAIQAELGASGHIDPTRTHLNETLCGPPTADEVAELARNLMQAAGISSLRKDAVLGLELIFSLPPGHGLDDRAYFSDCAAWAGNRFGGASNVLSVDIHRDEAAPHCHVLLLPLLNHRMVGSDMLGGKRKLMETQAQFFEAVASRYGLSKAPARLFPTQKKTLTTEVLSKLNASSDPALKSQLWAPIRDAIDSNPAPFCEVLGIVIGGRKKAFRTMAQTFTSKGKGPAIERNPIGFAKSVKTRSLSCVGLASNPPLELDSEAVPICGDTETVRVRDADLNPAFFDPETGEFLSGNSNSNRRDGH